MVGTLKIVKEVAKVLLLLGVVNWVAGDAVCTLIEQLGEQVGRAIWHE